MLKLRIPTSNENGAEVIHVTKEGRPTGVAVTLLQNDTIIVSGLKPEWPPWVKLEPGQARISTSFDGMNWEQRSDQAELWALRTLDPRFLLKNAAPEERWLAMEIQTPDMAGDRNVKAMVDLNLVSADIPAKQVYTYSPPPMSAHKHPFEIEIEVKNGEARRITQEFPLSKERITLEFSQRKTSQSNK